MALPRGNTSMDFPQRSRINQFPPEETHQLHVTQSKKVSYFSSNYFISIQIYIVSTAYVLFEARSISPGGKCIDQ